MEKITLETIENSYKEAIRNKYKIEKVEGKNSHYLNNPSQALLRDLCWEIFSTNPKSDDLNVYRNFFRSEFKSEEDTSIKYTDKFRKVGRFYKGDIKPANITTVELAAILVDFQPRPFNNFRKKIDDEDLEIYNELKNTTKPSVEVSSNEEKVIDNIELEVNGIKEIERIDDSESAFEIKEPEQIQSEESEPIQSNETKQTPTAITTFVNMDNKRKPPIFRYIAICAVLFGLGLIIYLVLPKKDCIQWSGDHYDEVSCDLKIEGIGTFNSPDPYDERIINLRRIKVCDTTAFFKNDKAIVWYTKVGDSVEFFNTHGNHPENGKALRPITQYIINKYVKK